MRKLLISIGAIILCAVPCFADTYFNTPQDFPWTCTSALYQGEEIYDGENICLSGYVEDEGDYIVSVDGTDEVFTYDTTDPEITINGIKSISKESEEITISASDEGSGIDELKYSLSKDGTEIISNESITSGKSVIVEEEGEYELTVTSTDKAGNEAEETRSFEIDKTAPTATFYGVKEISNTTETIRIVASDNGSGLDQIKYSLTKNGDQIIVEKSVLSGEDINIQAEGKYTITSKVTDKAGNIASEIKSFEIDRIGPSLTISEIPDLSNKNQTFQITATDTGSAVEQITYTLTKNGSAVVTNKSVASGEDITVEEEGRYVVSAKAVDKAGNETTASASFEIDKTAPVTTYNKNNGWYKDPGNVIASSESDATVHLTIDGDERTGTGKVSYNNFPDDGEYDFDAYAVDKAGNKGDTVKLHIVKDTVAPKIEISGAEEGEFYNHDIDVKATVTDVNLSEPPYTMTIKNGSTTVTKASSEGYYTVQVEATDKAGNHSSKTLHFTIDKTPPETEYNIESGYYQDPGTIIASSEEEATVYMTHVDVTTKKKGRVAYDGIKKDGIYEFDAYAIDRAGNVGKTVYLRIVKDTVAPRVRIEGAKDGAFYNTDIHLIPIAEDTNLKDFELTVERNGEKGSNPATKEGEYTAVLHAVDKAGNEAETDLSFTIDKTKPIVHFEGPKGFEYGKIETKMNEKGKIFMTVYLENKKISEDNPYTPGADGEYTVKAYGVDRAGNISEMITRKFVKDTQAPKTRLTGPSGFVAHAANVRVEAEDRWLDKVETKGTRTLRGTTETIYIKKGLNVLSKNGKYHIEMYATDKSGNKSQVKTIEFTVDSIAPKVDLSVPSKINSYNSVVTPQASFEDDYLSNIKISIAKIVGKGGSPFGHKDSFGKYKGIRTFFDPPKTRDNDGLYELKAIITDKAGNTTTKTLRFSICRFGSVFEVLKRPAKMGRMLNDSIIVQEYNPSGISDTDIMITRDGQMDRARSVYVDRTREGNIYHIKKGNFLNDGMYSVDITSKDRAGNTSSLKKPIKFLLDRTPPVITTNLLDGKTYKQPIDVVYAAEDTIGSATCIAKMDGAKQTGSFTVDKGSHTIEFEAKDECGNEATMAYKVTVEEATAKSKAKTILPFAIGGAFLAAVMISVGMIFTRSRKKYEDDIDF